MKCFLRFNPKYGMLYGSEKASHQEQVYDANKLYLGGQLTRVWTRAMLLQTCSDVHGFLAAQTVTD